MSENIQNRKNIYRSSRIFFSKNILSEYQGKSGGSVFNSMQKYIRKDFHWKKLVQQNDRVGEVRVAEVDTQFFCFCDFPRFLVS